MANSNVLQLPQQVGTADYSSVLYAVTGSTTDTGLPLTVLFNNPVFTGSPTVPGYLTTASAASTYAPLNSPVFTGTPTVPGYLTSALAASTYLTQANASSTYLTQANATSTYAPKDSPTFTGTVTIPTGASITKPNIVGTVAADNASAGNVGEYVTNSATGVSLTSGSIVNVCSISLTAGDWDVSGSMIIVGAATTTFTIMVGGTTSTSATLGPTGSYWQLNNTFGSATNLTVGQAIPSTRFNLSSTTTIYAIAQATFGVSTATANGFIRARRVR